MLFIVAPATAKSVFFLLPGSVSSSYDWRKDATVAWTLSSLYTRSRESMYVPYPRDKVRLSRLSR